MQTAIIADIQGNATALEAALYRIKQESVAKIVCLGDLVSGPEPNSVIDLLRAHDVLCVRGNMDEVILNLPESHGLGLDEDEKRYAQIDRWCHNQLSSADRAYLRALPLTRTVAIGSLHALCFHGSPGSTEDVVDSASSADDLRELFEGFGETFLLTGHMHLPMLRTLGHQIVLNPGSIGLPYGGKQVMPMHAEYAILSTDYEDFSIEFRRIKYDAGMFAQRLLGSGMPHAKWYLSKWQN